MTARRVGFGALAAAALVLLLGRWGSELYTNFLWFDALGAADVWRARVATTVVVQVTAFLVATAFAFVNLYAVRLSVVSLVFPRQIGNIEIGEEVPSRYLLYATLALAVVVGFACLPASERWSEALVASIGVPFGETDSYFSADLGFFVYWLPFETTIHLWAIVLFVVVTGLVVVLYALTPSLGWDDGRLRMTAYVRRHLIVLGGIMLLLVAWSYRLAMYRTVVVGGGTEGMVTSVDQSLMAPALLVLAIITFAAGVVVMWCGWSGQTRVAMLAVVTVLVLSILERTIAPLIARRGDSPSALNEERAYVSTRLTYTRRAYGVDRMRPETLGTGFPSAAAAVARIGVWDASTLTHAAQLQRRVRVVGDGAAWLATAKGISATLVEHSSELAGATHDVWGLRPFDPSTADDRGLPQRESPGAEETVVPEPAVYDGAPVTSVVSDSLHLIAGVELASTRSRVAHAWSLQNVRYLFGDLPPDRPTIVRFRDVRRRVAELAPYFTQGSEVLPLVANDSLYWVLELYATADAYPLSQRFVVLGEERGYVQHSATAVVHALSGRVLLIADPSPDPVTATWTARFPGLFTAATALPAAVRDALPPIRDGAATQALAFAAAGFRGDSLEERKIAPDGADSASSREPLHIVLPGNGVQLVWPLLDGRQRVRGVVAASGGGQRGTSWLPVASDGIRWPTALDRLRSSDSSAHEPAVARGPVRVVPVSGRPFYLQPSFQWRPGASPALFRVATLSGDTLRAGATLRQALGVEHVDVSSDTAAPADPRTTAARLYRAMRASLARGDWPAFGRSLDSLGVVLGRPSP